jgi:hypothetical protein
MKKPMIMNSLLFWLMFVIPVLQVSAQKNLDPIQTIKIGKNREFVINGKPFFPIMSWAQPKTTYAILKGVGVNTYCGNADPVAAKEAGGYAVAGFRATGMTENGYILAWIYSDEPDLATGRGAEAKPRQMPDRVAARCAEIRAAAPGRLIFITLTSSFMKESSSYPEEFRTKMYPEYAKSADVLGYDHYPIYGWGTPGHLDWVGSGVKQLCDLAGNKPVYAWIESSKGSKWMPLAKQPDVLPIHTRNEVWQAIINGATVIGYFTHTWQPDTLAFAPTPDMQKELARLNGQITRLAPAILADPAKEKIEMVLENEMKCQFKATVLEGSIYIFAQNMDLGPGAEKLKQYDPITPRSGKASFNVEGLKAKTKIEVIDENRTIKAEKGKFTDDFSPLIEHIYKFKK